MTSCRSTNHVTITYRTRDKKMCDQADLKILISSKNERPKKKSIFEKQVASIKSLSILNIYTNMEALYTLKSKPSPIREVPIKL